MRARNEPCYCHDPKELVAAGLKGIDLHADPETAPGATAPIALNNDAALAAIATAGHTSTSPFRPQWADSFKDQLNSDNRATNPYL